MFTSFLLGVATTTNTSLIIEGCIVAISAYGISKGMKGVSSKSSYNFKH